MGDVVPDWPAIFTTAVVVTIIVIGLRMMQTELRNAAQDYRKRELRKGAMNLTAQELLDIEKRFKQFRQASDISGLAILAVEAMPKLIAAAKQREEVVSLEAHRAGA